MLGAILVEEHTLGLINGTTSLFFSIGLFKKDVTIVGILFAGNYVLLALMSGLRLLAFRDKQDVRIVTYSQVLSSPKDWTRLQQLLCRY